jgi:hypothetical protein
MSREMLLIAPDPSPLIQVSVYLGGVFLGHALLTGREEWVRAWETVRTVIRRERNDRGI